MHEIPIQTLRETIPLFREIIAAHEPRGRQFVSFRQGVIDANEGYKVRNHRLAREQLNAENWSIGDIGTGLIAKAVLKAILVPGNNLLATDDRTGPDTRHQLPIERAISSGDPKDQEALFFELYRGNNNDERLFDEAIELFGRNYPLLGYLWFLRDIERYTPLRPQGLERGLKEIGIDYPLSGRCSWKNYEGFLEIVKKLRIELIREFGDQEVRFIDAHSFVWVIGSWDRNPQTSSFGKSSKGTTYGPVEIAAFEIAELIAKGLADSIFKTVSQSNGQVAERRVKDKSTDMDRHELEAHLSQLIREQKGRCALSGLPFSLPGPSVDADLKPSPDRINSDEGYNRDNIQVVCWFINRWKSDDSNPNFMRLLELVTQSRT